jgi:enoyl-CoA hydratase/carnithine racemase
MIKRSVYDGYQMGSEAGFTIERANLARLFRTKDAYEGFASFVEKRKPVFIGE